MSSSDPPAPTPQRVVHCADAVQWLIARDSMPGVSVITSLPDASEMRTLDFSQWERWFRDAVALVCSRVGDDGLAVFFQTDVERVDRWIDKAGMVADGAQRAGKHLLFHGIVCRVAPGTRRFGRAGYSHLLAYGRPGSLLPGAHPTADVLADAGLKPSSKSMGVRACAHACSLVTARSGARTILDPFCGHGTVLAVANALGLDAVGVDISKRMCQRARRLRIEADLTIDTTMPAD